MIFSHFLRAHGRRPVGFFVLLLLTTPLPAADPGFLGRPVDQWVHDLKSPSPRTRRQAAFALGKTGAEAAHAVPALLHIFRDPDAAVRETAAFALSEIAQAHPLLPTDIQDALPLLLAMLQSDADARARRGAALALGTLGADPGQVGPALRESLAKDQSALVRRNAAWALARLRSEPATLDALRQALRDPEPLVRRDAAAALAKLNGK